MKRRMQSKMKILIIGHVGKPVGGLSIYYESLLNSSISKKIDIEFIDSMSGTKTFAERGKLSTKNIWNGLKLLKIFISRIIAFQPDIVDIATAYKASFLKNSLLIIIAKLFGAKVVLRPRCSIRMFLPDKPRIWNSYVLGILGFCDGIIVLSNEWMILEGKIKNKNIALFPNAIDLSLLSAIERVYIDGSVEILFLGHIGKEKGIFDLIEAISSMDISLNKRFKLRIVGESLKEQEVKKLKENIIQKGLSELVKILPPVYGDSKNEYFRSSDIFVLPSHHEGMPISIIEAMGAALPIVASTVGGIPDLIEDGITGLLIPPHDTMALSKALEKLILSEELRDRLGNAAREYAKKNHEIEGYIAKLINYYQMICEGK